MKKNTLYILVISLVITSFVAACAPQATPVPEGEMPPAEMMKIKVATDATFPPFEIVDEATKELTGFDVELMNAIAAEAGFEVEWVNIGFDPMLAGLAECQYDAAIAAITITPERQEVMLFSDPYINAGQIVTIKSDNAAISGKDDLAGKTVGAQLGTTGAIEAEAIEGVTLKTYDSYDLAFLDLANGQIDAVIADYPTALGFVGQSPDQIKVVGEVFTNESYGIAVCKTNTELLAKMNEGLKAVKDAGVISELEQKWLASAQ
ncbi:MAG: basic amino acid ABC transporter substrate-binding protein [Anaerolineae bacterium]|nr:basic amino acid ABC transporter substrate-binding protein [Anaerolineae bacterium]